MDEFLNKLYSYDNFGIYLTISIVVLIILFFVVLFFGKKDQKNREIEATKKLQQITGAIPTGDALVNSENLTKEEVREEKEVLENDTIVVPNISDLVNNQEEKVILEDNIPEPILPATEPINFIEKEEEIEDIVKEETPFVNEPVFETPVLEEVKETPFAFDSYEEEKVNEENIESNNVEVPEFNFDEILKAVEETKVEEEVKEEPIIVPSEYETPVFEPEIIKNEPVKEVEYTKGPEIFSSVYAPKQEEVKVEEPVNETSDDMEFDMPTLKQEEVVPKVEEVEFDKLPEMPDYNLNDLTGETYDLNK